MEQEDDRHGPLKKQMNRMKLKDEQFQKSGKLIKSNKNNQSIVQLLPSRSRRIFEKLWVVGKGLGENRSSETSGSSQTALHWLLEIPSHLVHLSDTQSTPYLREGFFCG